MKKHNKKLSDFKISETGIVTAVLGKGQIRRRLLDMGITSDVKITLIKKAPFGDPLEVFLRGYVLTLRKSEASLVEMKIVEEKGKNA